MRLIGLLLSVAIIGYLIVIYINPSKNDPQTGEAVSNPQQTVDRAREVTDQVNEALKQNLEKMQQSD